MANSKEVADDDHMLKIIGNLIEVSFEDCRFVLIIMRHNPEGGGPAGEITAQITANCKKSMADEAMRHFLAQPDGAE